MRAHRFSIGQSVKLSTANLLPGGAVGPYQIEQLMPFDGLDFQYRLKSSEEKFHRVAREHELSELPPSVWR